MTTTLPVVGRQLRDFAVGAVCALVIATCAFVGVRNRELAARQIDLARRSAAELAAGREALPTVHGGIVGAATASVQHPYIRHRRLREGGGWRVLGGGSAAQRQVDDKLFYDAANRFDYPGAGSESRPLHSGTAFAELLDDGTGRAIAATGKPDAVAVAITSPAAPAPYPWLVIVGVLGSAPRSPPPVRSSVVAASAPVHSRASPRSRSRRCCGSRGSRPASSSCSAARSRRRSKRT